MITATLARLMRHPPGPPLLEAAPPTQADQRMTCNTCSSTSFRPLSASIESCSCSQALEVSNNSPATQSVVRSCDHVMDQLQDWEFAGDEEIRDINHEDGHMQDSTLLRLLGTNYTAPNPSLHLSEPSSLTSLHQDGEPNAYFGMANSEVGASHSQRMMVSATEFDWMEPPPPPETTAESISGEGGDSIMLEAFHQFQHNPQVQKMVVALATDEEVWRALLANEKLQEYSRRTAFDGDYEAGVVVSDHMDCDKSHALHKKDITQFILNSHKAFRELRDRVRECVHRMFEITDKTIIPVEARHTLFNLMLKSCVMLTVMTFTLVIFLCLLPLQASQGR